MSADTKWILLVDDEKDILDSVRELLMLTFGDKKLKIVESENGMDATSKVKNQKFDCIITDMKMPKKEGDAFIVSVRQNPFNEETPIIVLTGFPNERIVRDYRFTYLLEKPFVHNDLTDLVATQLKVGNKGERIAADMVNNIINASRSFLTAAFGTDQFGLNSPVAKKLGEPLSVEYVSIVNMYDNGIHNSFSLLTDEKDLQILSDKMKHLDKSNWEKIAYALGQSILKHAMRGMVGRGGVNASIVTYKGDEARQAMQNKKGIMIQTECEGVNLRVLACGESKLKKAG